ncbi:hypothetical protein M9R32_08845 [Paenisporosarcina quisquiliarum]|uniref:Uncharacterized protein n=1 Tax=Paenisporosarcina quisquiliarum TaxID=365346 RepID=A0A9X3RCY8_9BACL|nr:hypothetical protein [Paenisporosarcina quisquiliarum]MCZ8537285.1 hypothetical protein [Paenisporosarcina quisquiliarum]
MLKTIKGKVIAGTVSVALLSSAGVAFANSSAGDNLENWYENQFGAASSDIVDGVESHVTSNLNGWATEYAGLRAAAGTSIGNDRDAAKELASTNIDNRTQEHIDSINSMQIEIEGYMNGQFAALETAADTLILQAGNAATNYANNDLTGFTGSQGDAARASLITDLGNKQTEAVTALQTAIAEAKADLQGQLDANETATTQAIKDAIDAKIVELRGTITQKRDDLVAAQKVLIDAKALELENAAKAALQTVVDGI